jgi:hypothetical protein
MKKTMLLRSGALLVAAAVAGLLLWAFMRTPTDGGGPATSGASTAQYKVVAACHAFALADAQAVLGEGARAGSTNGKSDSASDDIAVSTCSYSGGSGEDLQATKTVTFLARSAKTKAGAESNLAVFGADKPAGKQDISGVGDAAFWDAQMSQLDILKGNNWYIIGNMSGTRADSGTLDVSRAVYNHIKAKL